MRLSGRDGEQQWAQIATDAFGNALASSVVGAFTRADGVAQVKHLGPQAVQDFNEAYDEWGDADEAVSWAQNADAIAKGKAPGEFFGVYESGRSAGHVEYTGTRNRNNMPPGDIPFGLNMLAMSAFMRERRQAGVKQREESDARLQEMLRTRGSREGVAAIEAAKTRSKAEHDYLKETGLLGRGYPEPIVGVPLYLDPNSANNPLVEKITADSRFTSTRDALGNVNDAIDTAEHAALALGAWGLSPTIDFSNVRYDRQIDMLLNL